MSYVINTVAAAPMPGWASATNAMPVLTSTSAPAASGASPSAPAVTAAAGISSVSSPGASSAGVPQMLSVESVVSSDSHYGGSDAPGMLPVTSVFTESDDGGAASGTMFSLPFTSTHGAGSDGDSGLVAADLGDGSLLDGWFVA